MSAYLRIVVLNGLYLSNRYARLFLSEREAWPCDPATYLSSPPSALCLAPASGRLTKSRRRPTRIRVNIEPRAKPTDKAEAPLPKANIRVDTTVVLIPVTVTDPLNRFVTGLEKENFKISEDKVEQKIRQFSSEDAPLSVGLVFDTSGSMGNKMEKSRQAVAEFLKTMNPEDEAFLVEFNDRAELALGFTRSPEEIQNKLTFTQSKGRTALLDAVYMALHTMKKAHNSRKALLIISDGGDNSSRYTETEIKNLVREADVQIYAIGIYRAGLRRAGGRRKKWEARACCQEISEQTGGRAFGVENLGELTGHCRENRAGTSQPVYIGIFAIQSGTRRQVSQS